MTYHPVIIVDSGILLSGCLDQNNEAIFIYIKLSIYKNIGGNTQWMKTVSKIISI